MRLNVYSIFDVAAGVYGRPIFVGSDAEALRLFGDIALDAEHSVGKHPEDYSIARIGTYDDNKGQLVGEAVEFIGTALAMVSASKSVNQDQMELLEKDISEQSPGGTA